MATKPPTRDSMIISPRESSLVFHGQAPRKPSAAETAHWFRGAAEPSRPGAWNPSHGWRTPETIITIYNNHNSIVKKNLRCRNGDIFEVYTFIMFRRIHLQLRSTCGDTLTSPGVRSTCSSASNTMFPKSSRSKLLSTSINTQFLHQRLQSYKEEQFIFCLRNWMKIKKEKRTRIPQKDIWTSSLRKWERRPSRFPYEHMLSLEGKG